MAGPEDSVLYAEDIHKSYPGVDVLRGVTVALRGGEVHALLGVGGSGKSTLVRIFAGVIAADTGRLYIDGRDHAIKDTWMASAVGIGVVHQRVALLMPNKSVADNILLAHASRERFGLLATTKWQQVEPAVQWTMDLLQVQLDLREQARNLTLAEQQMAKIVMALSMKPRILILDEPTQALSEVETNGLFRGIRTLVRQGTTVFYLSHRLDEVLKIADRVSLIKEGRIIGTMRADEADLRALAEMLIAETSQAMALREADRLRREFVSLVSHELRTPLATIRGYAETVMSRSWSEEIRQECLQNISNGCERLTELVDNLLDMSSLERGILRVEKEPVSLPGLALQAVQQQRRRETRSREFELRFPVDFPMVSADPKRIEQVLHNLLDNAVKYSPSDSRITISGEVDAERRLAVVVVEDRGVGMSAEHLERAFERFYRVPGPETAGVAGSGLGLAICRGIVESHGGQIWAQSAQGQGSAFSFSLPLGSGTQGSVGAR